MIPLLLFLLHVIDRAQLGIDEYVQTPEQVIQQLCPLVIEHPPILLPSFSQLCRRWRRLLFRSVISMLLVCRCGG